MKFLLANLADFDASKDLMPVNEWLEIDRYALHLTQTLQAQVLADYSRYEFHLAVQKLVAFCSDDLGSFYLDILKDRLYTAGENSPARRAAQSALHHITHTFMRLVAPILSFTADEIWQSLNLSAEVTVFEDVWYSIPRHGLTDERLQAWEEILRVRSFVAKQIEMLRTEGKVGSSLQAELEFHVPAATYNALASLEDDLRFVMITSKAELVSKTNDSTIMNVSVTPSAHQKCDRCWHYRADVGADKAHPHICGRCVSNLFGKGEARKYA